MIFGGNQMYFLFLTGSVFLVSFVLYVVLLAVKGREIFGVFKAIPKWLIGFNVGVLLYKIVFLVGEFCSRQDFGVWIVGTAKNWPLFKIFIDQRSPVYFFMVKSLHILSGGVSFDGVVVLNVFLSFFTAFFVYLIAFYLFKDKTIAAIASLLFIISPVIFIFSLTEDYTNPALFFSIQALFFACLYLYKKRDAFIWLAIACSLLAVGSRPEYIFFDILFFLFLVIFVKGLKKSHYIVYGFSLIPKFLVAVNMYLEAASYDYFIHGKVFEMSSGLKNLIYGVIVQHGYLFVQNFTRNLEELFNPYTLVGVYLIFAAVAVTVSIQQRKYRKEIGYFVAFYLILFLFYSYLHREGVQGSFKYLSSMLLPLCLLAAYGLVSMGKFLSKFTVLLIVFLMMVYSFYITTPETLRNDINGARNMETILGYYFRLPSSIVKEHEEYKKLSFDNQPIDFSSRLKAAVGSEYEFTFHEGPEYISNNIKTMLYATDLGAHVHPFFEEKGLNLFLSHLNSGTEVYVYQGIIGFEQNSSTTPSYFEAMTPERFQEICFEYLTLEEKIIDYEEKGSLVFFYKMRAK
jgi:hypothetical protein